jgi:GAF domain-containing protein
MGRRDQTGGKRIKAQRRKTSRGSNAAPERNSSTARQETKVARLTRELEEARQQQTATSEVLKVISGSPGELRPVFNAMLENATRICEASYGMMFLREGSGFSTAAIQNLPRALAEKRQQGALIEPIPDDPLARLAATKQKIHIFDARTEKAYRLGFAPFVALVEDGGARTLLVTPLLRESELIGAFAIYRQEVRPFTERQIELVEHFAAQAVIAIENTRVLNELRESLQQQTATADVLKAISRSAFDLKTVLDALVEAAARLCEADQGSIARERDGVFERVGEFGMSDPYMKFLRTQPVIPERGTAMGRALLEGKVVHIPDVLADPDYTYAGQRLGGIRAILTVPMLRDGTTIGVLGLVRHEARPFTDKQIELLKTFADQAAIAIENVRLFESVEARTRELSESLDQQTATSQVLRIISSSPAKLEPVFQAILANAVRICEAKFGQFFSYKNGKIEPLALHGITEPFANFLHQRGAIEPRPGSALERLVNTKTTIHVEDYAREADTTNPAVTLGGARSYLAVPMLREDDLIGLIVIYREEVRPFTDKQIELVENFAAQAVIAIENARLLNELNDLNQQLERRVADQVGEIERMGRLRRFLPPQVADLIVASGAEKQLESHRREITALFCDLRGFTGFSEKSDPEDVMSLLREYHAAIGEIIVKYSGTLEHYAGDGVMVFFNDPIPVENPALQAVQTALEMRMAIEALTEKWRRLGHELGFGVGIAHGFATLGTIGFEGRFDYAAIGTVSNVASRLCDEAKPGQILISPRVLMAVEDAVNVEPVGEFTLKGISRPVAAYNVLSAVSAKI